jgi:hypothetical protein
MVHYKVHQNHSGTGAPTDKGYTKIYSNLYAFAALKADGSITIILVKQLDSNIATLLA